MTSRTVECCGYGRDQLVYNLQFTYFHSMQDELFSAIRPNDGDVITMANAAKWYLVGPLDARTHRRTLRTSGVVRPTVLTLTDLAAGTPLPDRMRFIAYPNVINGPELRAYSIGYEIKGPFSVAEDGYRLDYYELTRRYQALIP